MRPLGVVILIVLVDLLGFSLVMPLLPLYAKHYGFADWKIGLLFAAFPMCQLIAGPVLGRLSDRYGRRPLLVFSQAGTALSFVILGLSHNYWIMLLARMLDGASGGNILVAQAYVADVTPREHRARGMGLIGMAFGLGFVLGPLLGGLLLKLPIADEWRLSVPFLAAAGFSTLAWVLVIARLPESLPRDASARQQARVLTWRGALDVARLPNVGVLVSIGFLAVLGFAAFEGTFALFMRERLEWDASTASFAFAGMGLWMALVQGGLIRRLVPRFGEARLIVIGAALSAVGFALLAMAFNVPWLAGGMFALGLGQGIISPSVSGLLSRTTPDSEQGAVFGTLTPALTLARLLSYMAAPALLGAVAIAAPYWYAFVVELTALAIGLSVAVRLGERSSNTPSPNADAGASAEGLDAGLSATAQDAQH